MTTVKCSRRHFLKAKFDKHWIEVSKKQWLDAEHEAGFHSTGFSNGGIDGRYTDDGSKPT